MSIPVFLRNSDSANAEPVKSSSQGINTKTNLFINDSFKHLGILTRPSYGMEDVNQILINIGTQFVKILAEPSDNFCHIDHLINNAVKANQMIVETSCPEEYTVNPQTDDLNELIAMNEYYLSTFVSDENRNEIKEILSALSKKLFELRMQNEFKKNNIIEKSSWWNVINPVKWVGWVWTVSKTLYNRISQKAIELQPTEYTLIYHKQLKNRYQITTTNYLFLVSISDNKSCTNNDYYYVRTYGYKFATFDQNPI